MLARVAALYIDFIGSISSGRLRSASAHRNFRGYRIGGHTLLRTSESYPPFDHASPLGASPGFHGWLPRFPPDVRGSSSSVSDPRILSGFGTPINEMCVCGGGRISHRNTWIMGNHPTRDPLDRVSCWGLVMDAGRHSGCSWSPSRWWERCRVRPLPLVDPSRQVRQWVPYIRKLD